MIVLLAPLFGLCAAIAAGIAAFLSPEAPVQSDLTGAMPGGSSASLSWVSVDCAHLLARTRPITRRRTTRNPRRDWTTVCSGSRST